MSESMMIAQIEEKTTMRKVVLGIVLNQGSTTCVCPFCRRGDFDNDKCICFHSYEHNKFITIDEFKIGSWANANIDDWPKHESELMEACSDEISRWADQIP